MKPEFRDAYLNLFYEYPRQAFEYINPSYRNEDRYDLVRLIRNRIIELNDIATPARRMRSDAMYFLLVNIHHMIIKPILEVNRGSYIENEQDILDDLNTIVTAAFAESEQGEISGHAVLGIVNSIWRDLRMTKVDIWGDDKRLY